MVNTTAIEYIIDEDTIEYGVVYNDSITYEIIYSSYTGKVAGSKIDITIYLLYEEETSSHEKLSFRERSFNRKMKRAEKAIDELRELVEAGNQEYILEQVHKIMNETGGFNKPFFDSLVKTPEFYTVPPQVNFLRVGADTVYLEIMYDYQLTQAMGSAGAQHYLDSIGNIFLGIEFVNYVSFDFVAGDHAMPGVYSEEGCVVNE